MSGISPDYLDRLFPFHLRFDRAGTLLTVGSSLRRVRGDRPLPATVTELAEVRRPRSFDPATLADDVNCLALLRLPHEGFDLRGQISTFDGGETFYFFGSPWVTDQNVMKETGLVASDFALHDPTADHLILLGTLQNALRESRELSSELQGTSRELHNERALLARILSEIPYAIYWKDAEGRYLGCDELFATEVGLDDPTAIIGLTDDDLPRGETTFLTGGPADRDVIRSGTHHLHDEVAVADDDGAVAHLSITKLPLRDGERITGMVGVIVDVTERRNLEEHLAHSSKMESIGQLTAGVAHEINTPIQFIGDNLRFLQDTFVELSEVMAQSVALAASDPDEPDPGRRLAAIRQALQSADFEYLAEEIPSAIEQSLEGADRVRQIVTSMKEFSHPGSEGFALADLNHLVESTITVARNEWKYVAEVATDLDPELPGVPCLPGELNQVVLNIIVNAAHAVADAPGEKGLITVGTGIVGDRAEIRVTDTGTGIPDDVRQRIFDPFFTTKEVGIGSGQGLALAHNVVVNKHRGALDVDTELGAGTTFVIRLPLSQPGFDAAETEAS